MAGRQECTLRIEMVWDEDRKRWRVISTRALDRGVKVKTTTIDVSQPLDDVNCARIRTAIEHEMLSWLPWE